VTTKTAEITLRLFGPLRTSIGQREVRLSCVDGTIMDALSAFVAEQGEAARPFVFDEQGNQRRSVILLLNGEPVADARTARLRPGDMLDLLLPLAGG